MPRIVWILLSLVFVLSGCQKTPQEVTPAPSASSAPTVDPDGKAFTGRAPIMESGNLLVNSGFEAGLVDWKWLDWSKGWAPFELSTTHAYEGLQSLHLPILSKDKRQTVVWGGVKELTIPAEIPECIEGYYFVENWDTGNWKQYLQLVVIDLSHPLGEKQGDAQLRYIISGSKEPPLSISNAQYLFVEKTRRDIPVVGRWTKFNVNPKADFMRSWNYTPQGGSNLRVLFEGRFDKHATSIPARGDVYFDNLYFGPKTATRCAD